MTLRLQTTFLNAALKGAILIFISSNSWSNNDNAVVDSLSIMDKIKNIEPVNPSQWGVHGGCITVQKIRRISFLDDQLAIVYLRGKKQLVLKLRNECQGIAKKGFSYKVKGGQLCPRFDRLKQVQSGMKCEIDSIEPYVRLLDGES